MSEASRQLTVSHRIPITLVDWIEEQAEQRRITKSAVLRQALEAAKAESEKQEGREAA